MKALVTGAFGQIGTELVPALQSQWGKDNIIALGNVHIPKDFDGIVEIGRLPDKKLLESIIKKHKIDTIYHLVSLLSAKGEVDPGLTWDVNVGSLKDVLDLARDFHLKVFWPSSIAAFGPTTPRQNTPQHTVLEPTTMYGVTKVAGELLCQYYFLKNKVDVRSVRYPGLISWKAEPGGGTTDFAVAVFYEAIKNGIYDCFVREDTILPMMYMDDAIRGTLELMDAPKEKITIRTSYNFAAMSFSASDLVKEIQKHLKFKVKYTPDHRQLIADSWPQSIDDKQARHDWNWQPKFGLEKMVKTMLHELGNKLKD